MSKYIDAEKLCEGLVSNDPVVIAAKCAPEEDVAPVVHANWKNTIIFYLWSCSNCQVREPVRSLYCPWCGAKMDKKEKENE